MPDRFKIRFRFFSLRSLVLILFSIVLLVILSFGQIARNNSSANTPAQLILPSYSMLNFERNSAGILSIGEREFRVPTVYVDGGFTDGRKEGGAVLLYVLPDYSSRFEFASEEERRNAFQDHHFGHMLVDDGAQRPSFDVMVANRKRGVSKIEQIDAPEGLEGYAWYRPWNGKITPYYHVYIERGDNGQVVSWLDCSTKARGPNPGCSYQFTDKNVFYDLYFDIAHLRDWRTQRKSAIEFLDSLEISERKR